MRAVFILAACLVAVTAILPDVSARPPPVGGCESGATVEYCQPVCVTTPCNPWVCVRPKADTEYCYHP